MKPGFYTYRCNIAALVTSCCLASFQCLHAAEPLAVCSPDGTHVASATQQGRIQYCLGSDFAVQGTFYICHPRLICFSGNGKLLAAAGGRNGSQAKIKVWRLEDHQQLCEIITRKEMEGLAVSTDGRLIVGASADGQLEAWRVSDGQSLWVHIAVGGNKSIRFSPDSKHLLVHCEDGSERQFSAENGRSEMRAGQ